MPMIDCDVHQNFNNVRELGPWLDPAFRGYVEDAGFGGFRLPEFPWLPVSGFTRDDAVPPGGGVPGSNYEFMREQLLDAFDLEYAILTGEEILHVSCLPHPQLASALATAYNRWLIDEWLPKDPRLKGSMVVATQDAEAAAAEIRRVGDHPDVVQVLLPCAAPVGYGDTRFHPIYEAAMELGLPVAMHVAGEGMGVNPPPTSTGYPKYYIEWHTLLSTTAMSHVVSLVCHGVFEKYRDLRFVIIEAGIAWLPGTLWRLDADWKALRAEVPWVTQLPSETVRQHFRFTTQPLEQPPNDRMLRSLLDTMEGIDTMLMFATDYPHWDFDSPDVVARRFPSEWRERVMTENARELYRLPARDAETPLADRAVARS